MTFSPLVKAVVAALGNSKEYALKQYLVFAQRLQAKAKASLLRFDY